MSRWGTWSKGSEHKEKRGFASFMKEDPQRMGNPAVNAGGPAERAAAFGLQSDGSGNYIDPKTGQKVATTVNNELVFMDNNRATGGAISDSSGGAALTQAAPSWVDPMTGMVTVPPAQPESPEEISAIPDATPATAPKGYDAFMNKKKDQAYAMGAGGPEAFSQGTPEIGLNSQPGNLNPIGGMGGPDLAPTMGENYNPDDLAKRDVNRPVTPQERVKAFRKNAPTLQQFVQNRRPKSGKTRQASFDNAQNPGNAPGVDKGESDRQATQVANMDPVDKALDKTSPDAMAFDETMMKQRQARAISLAQKMENVKPDSSPVGRQELASAIAMMHSLRNSGTNTGGGSEELFQKLQAVYPDMVSDNNKNDWYDSFIGQGKALRKNLGIGDDEIDDDWAVERTANRNAMDFIDPEDQQDFMQYTWDKLGDGVRKMYGSQLDSFNPADLTFARKSQLDTMKTGIDNIVKEFGNMPDMLPGLINTYMDQLEQAGHLHRASLKQGDTEKGVEVQGKPVNQGDMKGFNIDYDDEGNPRLFSGGFLKGQNPRTSLSIKQGKDGSLGFDSHSLLMSPFFETGGKQDRYSIENKVSSLMGDAVESRELPEAKPENVPWKNIKPGPFNANARGGGIPVQELAKMIGDATGEDINFRLGVKQKLKKDGSPASNFEPDQFTDEDKTYWGEMLQSLMDEQDDDGNPFFNFGDGPDFNGDGLTAQDWINRTFDMANNGSDGENKHEKKFTYGLRSKLRQFRMMQMLQQAKQKGPGDLAKILAKMKYMAKKQGISGDLDKGGYTLYQ